MAGLLGAQPLAAWSSASMQTPSGVMSPANASVPSERLTMPADVSITRAAAALHIHEDTLRYRLRRIREQSRP